MRYAAESGSLTEQSMRGVPVFDHCLDLGYDLDALPTGQPHVRLLKPPIP